MKRNEKHECRKSIPCMCAVCIDTSLASSPHWTHHIIKKACRMCSIPALMPESNLPTFETNLANHVEFLQSVKDQEWQWTGPAITSTFCWARKALTTCAMPVWPYLASSTTSSCCMSGNKMTSFKSGHTIEYHGRNCLSSNRFHPVLEVIDWNSGMFHAVKLAV